MINNTALLSTILKMDAFMMKKGRDLTLKRDLINNINLFTGDDGLDTIFINTVDHVNIPDVAVIPRYAANFGMFALNPDITVCCPYGYTVEIHQRCFDKYKSEELVAIIIHHILQNVQSSVAKSRFMGAWAESIRDTKDADILGAFDDISHSEVMYMAYLDICLRPLNVPVGSSAVVGTDDVLRSIGLDSAFNSALHKMTGDMYAKLIPDEIVSKTLGDDIKSITSIIQACQNNTIHHYFDVIQKGLPLLTIQNIMKVDKSGAILGFVAKPLGAKVRAAEKTAVMSEGAMLESILNPKNEIELRYQVDKIITDMRFMEHVDERNALLFRTRTLTMKVNKTYLKYQEKLAKKPGDPDLKHKVEYLSTILDELEMIREKIVNTELKPHQIGLIVKYPAGYEY